MVVQLECPNCRSQLATPDRLLGRMVRCQKCNQTFSAQTTRQDAPAQPLDCKGPVRQTMSPDAAGPSAIEPDLPGMIGGFAVHRLLGEGAFGHVFLGRDATLDRWVALKVPHAHTLRSPGARQRFEREARAAARLRHPHIVSVYAAGFDGRRHFIAAEFIAGPAAPAGQPAPRGLTLEEALDQSPLDARQAARTVHDLAEALHYAHTLGIVHRDVKPSNVMVDARMQVHLADFGLASQHASGPRITRVGAILGTPAYMAPELARGSQGAALPASDQYSVGIVLYEMLCGGVPFVGPVGAVLSMQANQEPAPPRQVKADIPPDLEAICLKALAKRPEDRYASCQALADDLRRWLDGKPIQARAVTAGEQAVKARATAIQEGMGSPFEDLAGAPAGALRKAKEGRPSARWKRWPILIGAGMAALLLSFVGLWAGGVFRVKTADGSVLVVEVNEPTPDVFVDGEKVTVTWAGGGKTAEIGVKPGTRKVEVKKDGFTVVGEEVEIKDGKRQVLTVKLNPAPRPAGKVGEKPPPKPAPAEKEGDNPPEFVSLFNGKDLTGWVADGDCTAAEWKADANGIAILGGPAPTWGFLLSKQDYTSFVLRLQFQQMAEGAKSGIVIRGVPGARVGKLPYQCKVNLQNSENSGAVLWSDNTIYQNPTRPSKLKPAGEWNDVEVELRGQSLRVTVNKECVQTMDLGAFAKQPGALAVLKQPSGRIGLQKHLGDVRFRNIEIQELLPEKGAAEGFVQLFNGKDTKGWKTHPSQPGNWRVEEGVLIGSGPAPR